MSKTHRCVDCQQLVEHEEREICSSCGRCEDHCTEDHDFTETKEQTDA